MKQTITFNQFVDQFKDYERADNFSYNGLKVLYNHIEECYPDFDLDVIALCCEYSEDELDEHLENYGLRSKRELQDNTLVLDIEGNTTVIIANY